MAALNARWSRKQDRYIPRLESIVQNRFTISTSLGCVVSKP